MDQPARPSPAGEPLNSEAIVEQAYAGFSAKNQQIITREAIREVVREQNLTEERRHRPAPRLLVRHLRFTGAKHLSGHAESIPIDYAQELRGGVNVVLIPDNDVGKSSILKTIKYALTGDNSDYDADVGEWIQDVWLGFDLDNESYTSILSTRSGSMRLVLLSGAEQRTAEEAALGNGVILDVLGAKEVETALREFFFSRLGLMELSWTQQAAAGGGVRTCTTSWLTYFQAVVIPDGGDGYLVCDPVRAMGNQDGLIVSTFLGLRLARLLNDLGVERDRLRKDEASEKKRSEAEIQEAKEQIEQLEGQRQSVLSRIETLNQTQQTRRRIVEQGEPAQALTEAQAEKVAKSAERAQLRIAHAELGQSIAQLRALGARLREAVALHLHFTGIDVRYCPNCDEGVDQAAVVREREAHTCRLCGKQAHGPDPQEVSSMEAEAGELEERVRQEDRERDRLNRHIRRLELDLENLEQQITALQIVTQQGISYALPTAEEDEERLEAYQQLGNIQAHLAMAKERAEARAMDENLDIRQRIVAKVRSVLEVEAKQRNQEVLDRLAAHTQDVARRIGAVSITDVTCSALGRVQMKKNDTPVPFSGIKNQGERLRVKLAFFLAMMRLGREPGLGRHPGLLLIDQPGSAEMVSDDFRALAETLREIDRDLGSEVQILCFTARTEFEAATDPSKIYGPQAGQYAF